MNNRHANPILNVNSVKNFKLPSRRTGALAVFDIDNTLFYPSMGDLGSDQWFEALLQEIQFLRNQPEIYNQLINIILNLYFEVQQHTEVKPVEEKILAYLALLEICNVKVVLLTSRGVNLSDRTEQQLRDIGINMDAFKKESIILAAGDKDQPITYKNNVVYCSGNNKGVCLKAFLRFKKLRSSLFYVFDDKEKNLSDIYQAIKNQACEFAGFRYGYLDEHVKHFKLENTVKEIADLASKVSKIDDLYEELVKIMRCHSDNQSLWQSTLFYKITSSAAQELELPQKNDEQSFVVR